MPILVNDSNVKRKSSKNSERVTSIALVGNPNCGKTTLFNQLTGSSQYVGNWPGVTVEKKEGKLKFGDKIIKALDLPGIYSMAPYSPEEIITRTSLIEDEPDVIVNIIDSTNIERNLYLTTQLLEMGKAMVIAFNMIDIVEKKGDFIDYQYFSEAFGVPVIPISANKGVGINELIDVAIKYNKKFEKGSSAKFYNADLENVLNEIEEVVKESSFVKSKRYNVSNRWMAVKLFEDDKIFLNKVVLTEPQKLEIQKCKNKIVHTQYVDHQMIIADQRYNYICGLCEKAVKKKNNGKLTVTDKIDKFATNKFLAVPVFILIVMSIFYITFGPVGTYLKIGFENFIKNDFSNAMLNFLTSLGAADWTKSLVVEGVIEGVGSVVSFLPQIVILFTLLSLLEDSGYMARAAFITDKLLRRIGLSGRAFVPLLMGFGCSVPAVLGTRILEKEKDKRLTIFMIPFMSCSAKMPVYLMFVAALFPNHQLLVILSIYIIGIIAAIFTALLFKNTILKGEVAPFIMELPDYRIPTFKNLVVHVWEKVKDFIVKAGTVLIAASIVVWFLQSFDLNLNMVENSSDSILASIGVFIAPVFTLCGFGNWQAAVALLSGLIAKESVVSTMAVLYGYSDLPYIISNNFSYLSAYAFLIFVLMYTPCVAALSAIKRELKSNKLTAIFIVYQLSIAWFASAFIYQFGTLIKNIIGG